MKQTYYDRQVWYSLRMKTDVQTADLKAINEALSAIVRGHRRSQVMKILNRMTGADYDPQVFATLIILDRSGPMRVTDLAESTSIALPGMSRLVRRLMTLGLVEVADHPSDRRAVMIRISKKGEELVENRIKADRRILVRILSDWNEEDRSQFADLFTRFVRSIDRLIAEEANRQPA